MSYGFVNDNIINGAYARRHSPKQLCLYFSKNLDTEKKLRKKFDRIDSRFFMNINSNEMIVISIENESNQESIVFNFKKITINRKTFYICTDEKIKEYYSKIF